MQPPTLYPTPERRLRHTHAELQDALLSMTSACGSATAAHVPPELAHEMALTAERILSHAHAVAALRMQAAQEVDCGC